MTKQLFTTKPEEDGYYYFWPEDEIGSDEARAIARVIVETDEVFFIYKEPDYDFIHQRADDKLSNLKGRFKGPYKRVEDMED